jgi:hypothetical protein
MKPFAIWGLFDPDEKTVHIQHSTVPRLIGTLDMPVHRSSSDGVQNMGAKAWYIFQQDDGHRFPKPMDDWFQEMNARETHPIVKVLETGDASTTDVQARKADCIAKLHRDGFTVVTRHLGPVIQR